jgi:hypothetical protein
MSSSHQYIETKINKQPNRLLKKRSATGHNQRLWIIARLDRGWNLHNFAAIDSGKEP